MLLAIALLAGCGSAGHPAGRVAVVQGETITSGQFRQYLDYALRFYKAAGTAVPSEKSCLRPEPSCVDFRRQILRRLLEEHVVLAFARRHRIALSSSDLHRIRMQMVALGADGTTTAALLTDKRISTRLLQTVLENEALVRKVELSLTQSESERGPAYHLEVIAIPRTSGGSASAAYQEAVTLATDGRPVPTDASSRREWAAPFRLGVDVRTALSLAQPGDFLGPFKQGGHLLVVHLLKTGIHRYGRSARLIVQARLFGLWLAHQVRIARPQCFSPNDQIVPCPGRFD